MDAWGGEREGKSFSDSSARRRTAQSTNPDGPQASRLFRLVSDHLQRLQTAYDDRFAREYGPWRPVVAQVHDTFLACGVLDRGFARIRCDTIVHTNTCSRSLPVSLSLPKLSRQAARHLDAVARHDASRAGAAPAGRAHHPQTAARLLSVSAPPARRDRPRRCPHRHGRHSHADRRARPRGGHRGVFADAWLARELASAPAPARDRRRVPAGRDIRVVAWPHSGFYVHTAVWEGHYGSPRTIARSPAASRATAPGIPSHLSG